MIRALESVVRSFRYLAIAVWELCVARARHAQHPTGEIIGRLKEVSEQTPEHRSALFVDLEIARVAWAIGFASRCVPWRSDCLIQVMAAERWLRRNNVATSFFLGVAKDEAGQLKAHAWLQSGSIVVAGSHGEGFSPLIEPNG